MNYGWNYIIDFNTRFGLNARFEYICVWCMTGVWSGDGIGGRYRHIIQVNRGSAFVANSRVILSVWRDSGGSVFMSFY